MGAIVGAAPALVIESSSEQGVELVGQVLISDRFADVSVAFLVVDEAERVSSSLFDLALSGQDVAALSSRAALRSELQEKSIEFKKREAQVREYEQSLSRLQVDTDKIAQVDRIVDAEEQLEILRTDAKRLSAALSAIDSRKQALKAGRAPLLVRRQEAEVTAELNQLSVVLKSTEADALKRVSSASHELASKLELIKSTKNEHIDLLQNELHNLVRRRQALESGKGSSHD
jgi:hypothetical protein